MLHTKILQYYSSQNNDWLTLLSVPLTDSEEDEELSQFCNRINVT